MRSITHSLSLYSGFIIIGIVAATLGSVNGADYFTSRLITGTWGIHHNWGVFNPGGNAWLVIMPNSTNNGTMLDSTDTANITLSGSFFLETVGWATWDINSSDKVKLIPPPNGANVLEPWSLSGYAWSDNAGYMRLNAIGNTYSGVAYLPAKQSFTGYAWSDNLGYIPFGSASGVDVGFVGRVKVIGNIGGSKTFSLEQYSLGDTFQDHSLTDALNSIRRNLAIMTRNISDNQKNTSVSYNSQYKLTWNPQQLNNQVIFYDISGDFVPTKRGSSSIFDSSWIQSLIVRDGDIYINSDIFPHTDTKKPLVIIALSGENGSGGSIYIDKNVKTIQATLVATKSIYSGEKITGAWKLYNDSKNEITSLPASQLYIYGSVISHNTIGGSTINNVVCGYTESNCNTETSMTYDLNYWRAYDGDIAQHESLPGYDKYSVIIEHNPNTLSDPPPGLENLK